jgi:small subunit ribosomal protein S6
VVREESWGKRKLAYPIAKLSEGQYVILYVEAPEGVNPFPEVEQRLRQNEKILRYLTVRTDLDLKRAARKGKKKPRTGTEARS